MSLAMLSGSETTPKILMLLDGKVVTALLDTGATKSFLQPGIVVADSKPSALHVVVADGSMKQVQGEVTLEFKIGSCSGRHPFYLLEGLPESCILGMDFMVINNVQVCPAEAKVTLGSRSQEIHFLGQYGQNNALYCATHTVLPARSQTTVAVRSTARSGDFYLVEQATAEQVVVARSLHEGRPEKIMLLNPSHDSITLPKGFMVAHCETIPRANIALKFVKTPSDEQLWTVGSQLTQTQKARLDKFLRAYGGTVFATTTKPFGNTSAGEHYIQTLPGRGPLTSKLRPTSPAHRRVIREEVAKMVEHGVIRQSSSPWSSPIVLVKKKDGTVRFCVDFRKLNDITIKDAFPLPRTSDLLESFQGAKYFSTLDAAAGYWQVPLNENAIPKSAFICSEGLYEFLKMPFGLCNAPATYQRIMNVLLAGLNGLTCLVYLDDIIVFSRTFENHMERLKEVLDRLVAAEILLKPSKCSFAVDQVEYLGHIVSAEGIKPDPKKLDKLRNFPVPESVSDVRSFLGFVGYYRKFIRNFAIIASPLFTLLKNDTPFVWSEKEMEAFRTLLSAIETNAVLAHPDFQQPFVVDADASGEGIGAVLSQILDDKERPISFISRHLTVAEQSWHIREKEALAIIWALESFRHFLQGSKFHVRTDHSSLKWLLDAKTGRLGRWALRLMEFGPFQILHRSGKTHTNVDALSRHIPLSDVLPDNTTCFVIPVAMALPSKEEFISAQARDPQCVDALKNAWSKVKPFALIDGLVAVQTEKGARVLLPLELRDRVVQCYHEMGHFGVAKTAHKLLEKFHSPGAKARIAEVIAKCLACQQRKRQVEHHISLSSKPIVEPWHTVAADFCGPYGHGDYRYVLVIIDHFTKWVELIPLFTQDAADVAQAFYDRIICRFGCPRRFLTDQGSQFKSQLINALCCLFKIKKIFSSTYFPQGDGTAERFMRSLNNSLAILSRHHPEKWAQYVPGVAFAYNTSVHASTGETPFYLNTGRVPSFPEEGWLREWNTQNMVTNNNHREYVQNMMQTIQHARNHAKRCLDASWVHMNRKYKQDTKPIAAGDKVLIRLPEWERNRFPVRKMAPRWSEAVVVEETMPNGKTFRVRRNGTLVTVNRERLVKIPELHKDNGFTRHPSAIKQVQKEETSDSDEEWMLRPKSVSPIASTRNESIESSSNSQIAVEISNSKTSNSPVYLESEDYENHPSLVPNEEAISWVEPRISCDRGENVTTQSTRLT